MSQSILLTGATGFVGGNLLNALLERGYHITCLVRPKGKIDPSVRLKETLTAVSPKHGSHENMADQVQVLEGDITKQKLGLTRQTYRTLTTTVSQVFHCAASTNFSDAVSDKVWKCNVGGTQNMLRFVTDGTSVEGFHYVGTAYVAGDRKGVIYEDELDKGQKFNNGYERSKFSAEKMVKAWSTNSDVKVTIYRPGIIVGDYDTGTTISFNSIYLFLKVLHLIKSSYHETDQTGRKLVPIRILGNPRVTKNFVPVDFVVKIIMEIFLRPLAHGRTYHLTNNTPPSLDFIKEVIEEVLGISGIELVDREAFRLSPPTDTESLLRDETDVYVPYLLNEAAFDTTNLKRLFENEQGVLCPPMDRDSLIRLFEFAIKSNWGKKLRDKSPANASCRHSAYSGKPLLILKYFTEFLPSVIGRSIFAGLDNLNTVVAFRFTGSEKWRIVLEKGILTEIEQDLTGNPDVIYELDDETFIQVVSGALSPQQSFFTNRTQIKGDTLKGLKLAALFDRFIKEYPFNG